MGIVKFGDNSTHIKNPAIGLFGHIQNPKDGEKELRVDYNERIR